MIRRTLQGFSILAVGGLLWAAAPVAYASTELPFTSTYTPTKCLGAASSASSTPGATCEVDPSASPSSGYVSSSTILVSPLDGLVPWSAQASNQGHVVASYDLASSAKQLDFTVDIYVSHTSITLQNLPPLLDSRLSSISRRNWAQAQNALGNWVRTYVGATAYSLQCSSCNSGINTLVLTQVGGGTASASAQEYLLHFTMGNGTGADIPPGQVIVRAGVGSSVIQDSGSGNDSARINGVVRGIYLD